MPGSVDVLIMAAGQGKRFGSKKQFLRLGKSTVMDHSVTLFENIERIKKIIVVYPPDMEKEEVRKKAMLQNDIVLIKGGIKREDSVRNGLSEVSSEYVLIHDAVRPACTGGFIRRVIDSTLKYDAVAPGINPFSTVKYTDGEKLKTLDRDKVYLIQTPQGFKTSKIKKAYKEKKSVDSTDSSSVAEEAGIDVKIIEGEKNNIKITVPEDLQYIENIVGDRL